MNFSFFSVVWVQLLGLLAVEVGLLALLLALLVRRRFSTAWRRTFCQAAILAMLLLTVSEFSGAARLAAGWARAALNHSSNAELPFATPPVLATTPGRPSKGASRFGPARLETAVAPAADVALRSSVGTRGEAQGRLSTVPSHGYPPKKIAPAASSSSTRREGAESPRIGPATISPTKGAAEPAMPADSLVILWLGLIWATGAVLVAGRAGLARCLFVVFRLRRQPVRSPLLRRQVEALSRAVGIRRRVWLIESPRLSAPIAFGWLRPTIGLPLDFSARFDAAKREAMLAHELAHLAAHDPFWCLLADLASAVLWWHPAAWWMRRQLHLAVELAADEACLLVENGPSVLAECLVELGTRLVRPFPGQVHMAGFRSHLGRRVQRLLHLESRAWVPPRWREAALARILGPIVLVGVLILCSAWFTPQSLMKGDCLKTMQQNWKRSLAAFGLLAVINNPDLTVMAADSAKPAAVPPATDRASQPPLDDADSVADKAFLRRYGMRPPAEGGPVTAATQRGSGQAEGAKRAARIEAKLKSIVLPEVTFNNLPLAEVIQVLSDQSRKLDSEKQGINFLINPNSPPVSRAPEIDPATGLPLPVPVEQIDIASAAVNFNLPLRNVTLKDVLDAIVKVANIPIAYSVEDYAVVFSQQPDLVVVPPARGRGQLASESLQARTFKVNLDSFLAGLQTVFGIKAELPADADSSTRSRKFQSAMRDLLAHLDIPMSSRKGGFYNDLTGMVMVRANPEELETITAAMELLGATPMRPSGGGDGGAGSTDSAAFAPPGARPGSR